MRQFNELPHMPTRIQLIQFTDKPVYHLPRGDLGYRTRRPLTVALVVAGAFVTAAAGLVAVLVAINS